MKSPNHSCTLGISNKSCVPCNGNTPVLSPEKSQQLLEDINNKWIINNEGHLYKEYIFNNFIEAITFANKIAVLSEQEGHHPDLKISWGKCSVEIWTHKINGLSESDFILAVKIGDIK